MAHIDSICSKSFEVYSNSFQSRMDSLQAKVDALQDKSDLLYNIVETSNDSINNQLSAGSYLLALIAVVITVVGVGLGIYIEKKKREIDKIAKTIDEKEWLVTKIAKDTEDLDKRIHSNLSDLYNELRKEETETLIRRLLEEPCDISNLHFLLLSRELDEDFYPLLKEAYLNIPMNPEDETRYSAYDSYRDTYLLLFIQQFFYEALKDETIRDKMLYKLDEFCSASFPRDIIKTTIDLCKALSDDSSSFNKEDVLIQYLKAVNNSKHKKLANLRNVFEQNLSSKSLLQNAISRCTEEQVYLTLFGINPTETDNSLSQEQV